MPVTVTVTAAARTAGAAAAVTFGLAGQQLDKEYILLQVFIMIFPSIHDSEARVNLATCQ